MSRHDPGVSLQQMRDHAREALDMVRHRERTDLDSDRMLELSLIRLLEIVGEAARRIPAGEQARHPAIPWSGVIGLRDRLTHGYDRVDLDRLWRVVTEDLPLLVAELDKVVPLQRGGPPAGGGTSTSST